MRLIYLFCFMSLSLAAQDTVTITQTPGAQRSAADIFREQVKDETKPGHSGIDLDVPTALGERVKVHAELGKGTVPIIDIGIAQISDFYRYSIKVTNGTDDRKAYQDISGIRLNWEVWPEDGTKITSVPIGWRSPAKPYLISWATDFVPIKHGETVDGFVVDSKLAPGLVTLLVMTRVAPPNVDPHLVNTAALTGHGDKLGIEAIYNVPLVMGPKLIPSTKAIHDEIEFAISRQEFETMADGTPMHSRLNAMTTHKGQRLEQDFTELQQLALTDLQRQWASEMMKIVRVLPTDK